MTKRGLQTQQGAYDGHQLQIIPKMIFENYSMQGCHKIRGISGFMENQGILVLIRQN